MKIENWEFKVNDNINILKVFFKILVFKVSKFKFLLILIRVILIIKMRIIVKCF